MSNKSTLANILPIAIDIMGSKQKESVLFEGILRYLRCSKDEHNRFLLFGNNHVLQPFAQCTPKRYKKRFSYISTTNVVSIHDKPAQVLRDDTSDSSMHQALMAVASGKARACLSAGNSGALLGLAQKYLGLLPDISRPAICCRIPTKHGFSYMLDVGGTINLSSRRMLKLVQLFSHTNAKTKPSIGLLNISIEANKGTDIIQEADALFRKDPNLNYIGCIEGYSLFSGKADVILCEGFVGNLILKSIEGNSSYFQQVLRGNFLVRMLRPFLSNTLDKLDARRFNGAALLGLRSLVVKSHSRADATAFSSALEFVTSFKLDSTHGKDKVA